MIVCVAGELREYCYFETFNASCQPDEVILVTSAKYGRMRFGRCMKENHRGMGCYADVLTHLDRICSGRNSCDLSIPDQTLHSTSNCPKELMMYLEASYTCLKGNMICMCLFKLPKGRLIWRLPVAVPPHACNNTDETTYCSVVDLLVFFFLSASISKFRRSFSFELTIFR